MEKSWTFPLPIVSISALIFPWNLNDGMWEEEWLGSFPTNSFVHSFIPTTSIYWVSINLCNIKYEDSRYWFLSQWFSFTIIQRNKGPGVRFLFKLWPYLLYLNALLIQKDDVDSSFLDKASERDSDNTKA